MAPNTPFTRSPPYNDQPNPTHLSSEGTGLPSHTPKALSEQCIEITKKALETSRCFDQVYIAVRDIDDQKHNEPLAPEWDGHRQTYRHLLYDSRERATKIAGAIDRSHKQLPGILKDENNSTADKIAFIQNILQSVNNDSKKSQDIADGFDNLNVKVKMFRTKTEGFGTLHLEQLLQKICTKAGNRREHDEKRRQFGKIAGYLKGTFSSFFGNHSRTGPNHHSRSQDATCEKAVQERDMVHQEQAELQALCDNQIHTIVDALGVFEMAWTATHSHLRNIHNSLELWDSGARMAEDKGRNVNSFTRALLRDSKAMGDLVESMNIYATGIMITSPTRVFDVDRKNPTGSSSSPRTSPGRSTHVPQTPSTQHSHTHPNIPKKRHVHPPTSSVWGLHLFQEPAWSR